MSGVGLIKFVLSVSGTYDPVLQCKASRIMTGNMDDSIIACIINFEKYSLKRLYHECITHVRIEKGLHDNRIQTEIHLAQISRKFPMNTFKICNTFKKASLQHTAYVQVADLPLTGT